MSNVARPPPLPREEPRPTADPVLTELRALRSDVRIVVGQLQSISEWRGEVEQWRSGIDSTIMTTDSRAQQPSQHDVEIRNELHAERAARESLAKDVTDLKASQLQQTEMLSTLTSGLRKFFSHPLVVAIAAAGGGWILNLLQGHHP